MEMQASSGRKSAGKREKALPLSQAEVGEVLVLVELSRIQPALSCRLFSLGFLPGREVQILQRWPAFLFQVGQTQIATDREVAEGIIVRRKKPSL